MTEEEKSSMDFAERQFINSLIDIVMDINELNKLRNQFGSNPHYHYELASKFTDEECAKLAEILDKYILSSVEKAKEMLNDKDV